jgi:hypothetical protein
VAVISGTPRHIAIMNPDGSGRKRIRVSAQVLPNEGLQWSPDGTLLMYTSNGGRVFVVNPSTGVETDLGVAPYGSVIRARWRSDSRAVLYGVTDTVVAADSTRSVVFHERAIAGAGRTLRTMRMWCAQPQCEARLVGDAKFVNDTLVAFWRDNRYSIVNLRDNADPRVVYTRNGGVQPVPTFSANGRWMAVRVGVPGERLPRRIDVMMVDGSQRKSVALAFNTLSGPENPRVSDDGREIIVMGGSDTSPEFHRIDVASERATRIASFPGVNRGGFSPAGVSPDGRYVAYTSALPPYTTFSEMDISPLLTAAAAGRGR